MRYMGAYPGVGACPGHYGIIILWPKDFISAYKGHYIYMNTYFPFLVTDDVIPIVDVEVSAPPLQEGVTDQLEVTRSTVVLSVSKHSTVQVTEILQQKNIIDTCKC